MDLGAIKKLITGDDKPIKVGKYLYYKLGKARAPGKDKMGNDMKVNVFRAVLINRNKYAK